MDSGFTHIQDTMINKTDYLELGLVCADVCKALQRGMNGRGMDDLGQPAREAITQLTMWVEPATYGLGSSLILMLFVAELLRRYRIRSTRRVDGIYPPDLSTRRAIRT